MGNELSAWRGGGLWLPTRLVIPSGLGMLSDIVEPPALAFNGPPIRATNSARPREYLNYLRAAIPRSTALYNFGFIRHHKRRDLRFCVARERLNDAVGLVTCIGGLNCFDKANW